MNLQNLTNSSDETRYKAWIKNLSSRTRSTEEMNVLQKGLNYHLGRVISKEYLAELEHWVSRGDLI